MVQPRWVFVAFGAGLLVGVLTTRLLTSTADAPPDLAARPAGAQSGSAAAPKIPASVAARAPVSQSAPTVATPAASPDSLIPPPATPGLGNAVPARGAPSPFEPSVDSGVVQPIDVGDVFARQIARPSRPGEENEIGDAHRALEREPRDDAWAYAMEGELQNSMVMQTSTGAFKLEHVECRSTLCEVRVSGRADQQAALREWTESLATSGMSARLFPNLSSSYATNDRVDALYIFRRPRKQP